MSYKPHNQHNSSAHQSCCQLQISLLLYLHGRNVEYHSVAFCVEWNRRLDHTYFATFPEEAVKARLAELHETYDSSLGVEDLRENLKIFSRHRLLKVWHDQLPILISPQSIFLITLSFNFFTGLYIGNDICPPGSRFFERWQALCLCWLMWAAGIPCSARNSLITWPRFGIDRLYLSPRWDQFTCSSGCHD